MQNWPNWCHYRTNSLNKSRRNFSQRTHPIHSIGPKTYVSGCFRTFRYSTKVDAKLAELVPLTHQFVKESRVRIFHNERTRSTPLDAKTHILGRSRPFRCYMKVDAKLAKLAPLTHVLGRFGRFRYCMKVDVKLAELVPLTHKFAK
jgi:hypothetical protein